MKNFNVVLGILCLGLAFALLTTQQPSQQPEPSPSAPAPESPVIQDDQGFLPPTSIEQPTSQSIDESGEIFQTVTEAETNVETPDVASIPENITTLDNDFISVDFSNVGGAIKQIRFLQTKRGELDDYVFNLGSPVSALQLSRKTAAGNVVALNYDFKLVQVTENSIRYEYDTGRGITFVRTYTLATDENAEPYAIDHQTSIVNTTGDAIRLAELYLNLGTSIPVESDRIGQFQNFAYFNGIEDEFIKSGYFTGSGGFFGIGSSQPNSIYNSPQEDILWAAVKNQFFVSVITPEEPGTSVHARAINLRQLGVEGFDSRSVAIGGEMGFQPGIIPANAERQLNAEFFVGPKEYRRLAALGEEQDALMQFGWLGGISKILMNLMYFIQGFIPSWGITLVVMTIIIKGIFWPLTAMSAKSSKKMQLLQGPMKELREKYQDNPQKMQKETMELFKKYQVNPLAGCFPILLQMPIFIGMFFMLRTTAELRFEPFLWVSDLSLPDTVATVFGFPINIMPILMGVTSFMQIQFMPVSPNADPLQQKIMKLFPLIIPIFLYNYSSGLILYWTVQNIISVLQTFLVYRNQDSVVLPEPAVDTSKMKKAKAVRTPPKKRK